VKQPPWPWPEGKIKCWLNVGYKRRGGVPDEKQHCESVGYAYDSFISVDKIEEYEDMVQIRDRKSDGTYH
jgi:hypothetical protein